METTISEDTSKRITALRFLLIVMVVFIHNNFTVESIAESVANGGADILFNQNAFGKWVQLFISQGLARCAVPLFFLFAAYLQAKKADAYGVLLKKRAKSLLVPYVIWSFIYVFYYTGVKLIVLKIAPQYIANPENTVLSWTALDWFHKVIGYKSDGSGGFELPLAYQFWFIRDLLILIVLSPLLVRAIQKFPAGFFMLVSVVLLSPLKVYFVNDQALFFYVAGLYWGMYDVPLFEQIDKIAWKEICVLFLLCFFSTHTFGGGLNSTLHLITVLFACVIFLKISKLIIHRPKLYAIAAYLAGFSFFLFAIHTPIPNELLKRLWLHFFPMKNAFFCLFEYFGVTALTIVIGTGIGIALKKNLPASICSPQRRKKIIM